MNKKLKANVLSDDQLDNVAGGNVVDRTIMGLWVDRYYGQNGTHGKVLDTSKCEPASILESFCDKVGLEHRKSETGLDTVKINGEFRDVTWMISNKQETLAFLDAKLGIK